MGSSRSVKIEVTVQRLLNSGSPAVVRVGKFPRIALTFCQDIIAPSTITTRADLNPMQVQHPDEFSTNELGQPSLSEVMNQ